MNLCKGEADMKNTLWQKSSFTVVGLFCLVFAWMGIVSCEASYQSTVLADSPSVYYQFNETSGPTAVDSSGNANHGTYISPILLNQPGLLAINPAIGVTGAGS